MEVRIGNNIRLIIEASLSILSNAKFIYTYLVSVDRQTSTSYSLNLSGLPQYTATPVGSFKLPYVGFGLNPKWDKIYNTNQEIPIPNKVTGVTTIDAIFPAGMLRYFGKYNLILFVKTLSDEDVLLEYSNVFTLKEDSGVTGNVTVMATNGHSISTNDIYVMAGQLDGNLIKLTLTNNSEVEIDMSDEFNWYEDDLSDNVD